MNKITEYDIIKEFDGKYNSGNNKLLNKNSLIEAICIAGTLALSPLLAIPSLVYLAHNRINARENNNQDNRRYKFQNE